MSKYHDQARAAILTLDDRQGSSLPALKKKLKLTADKFRFLNSALKKGVESGAFIKNKGNDTLCRVANIPHERLSQSCVSSPSLCTWCT